MFLNSSLTFYFKNVHFNKDWDGAFGGLVNASPQKRL